MGLRILPDKTHPLNNTERAAPPIKHLRPLLRAQEPALLFQIPEDPRQLPHHARIPADVRHILVQHQREVENEPVPVVLAATVALDADGVAQDPVVVDADRDESVAELLSWNQIVGDAGEVEEWGEGDARGGRDGWDD